MFWKRLAAFFVPSPGALTITWAALIISLLLSLTISVLALAEPEQTNPGILYGFLSFPAAGGILAIAAFVERRPGARFLLWGMVIGSALLASVSILWAGTLQSSIPFDQSVSFLTCCCLPVTGGLGFVWVFFGWKAVPAFQKALRAARLQRLIEIIQARGEVDLGGLSRELALDEEKAEKLVRALITDGELMAYFDTPHRRIYSAAALSEKQRRLLAMVSVQGKASLDSLAGELNVQTDLVRRWIYALAQRGQLHGFADWAEGMVYSQDAGQILAQNTCPHCGGRLDVAGKGLIACEHCGVEIFL